MPAEDWRLISAYEPILDLNRSGFAWEFLRRNPRYRQDYAQLQVITAEEVRPDRFPAAWGLRFPG